MDGELPDGAEALLIHDPASPDRPILVVPARVRDDEGVIQGIMAFAARLEHMPSVAGDRRIIKVSLRPFHPTALLGSDGSESPEETRNSLADRLWKNATFVERIQLPGIGRATVFEFEDLSGHGGGHLLPPSE